MNRKQLEDAKWNDKVWTLDPWPTKDFPLDRAITPELMEGRFLAECGDKAHHHEIGKDYVRVIWKDFCDSVLEFAERVHLTPEDAIAAAVSATDSIADDYLSLRRRIEELAD